MLRLFFCGGYIRRESRHLLVLDPDTISGNGRIFLAHREREYMTSKTTKQAKKWHINQNSNPSWHKQPVYRCPPSADGYSPTKRNCGKWAYLHRPRFCHPWLSDTFARNTASTSIEPHKRRGTVFLPFLFFVVILSSDVRRETFGDSIIPKGFLCPNL